ncbi:hypothetical protein H9Q13_03380 [Pontibacter sp. JH31]|uniref:Uncharacterized protein n=1 Tax=Pontibacter aquaedesilientis TaxID=2766980 RepID=A0ABR7XE47_9BACT|nr:hypothetical protein [Pontibacter aquaedesilientis]MBD1396196.1 hypothetical protein [Pontibacter aquaedesilientis]
MNISPSIIANVGLALTVIIALAGIDKRLRSDRTLLVMGVAALTIGIVGFLIRSESTGMARGNAADFLFGPFIYVLSYGLLRKLYKSIYKVEPTYVWLSGYDAEDMRDVNFLDKVVYVLPLLLGMVLPFIGKVIE